MAKCAIYEEVAHSGNNMGHSHRRGNRIWKVGIKSVKVKTEGGMRKMYVRASCLRSNFVERT